MISPSALYESPLAAAAPRFLLFNLGTRDVNKRVEEGRASSLVTSQFTLITLMGVKPNSAFCLPVVDESV